MKFGSEHANGHGHYQTFTIVAQFDDGIDFGRGGRPKPLPGVERLRFAGARQRLASPVDEIHGGFLATEELQLRWRS